MSSILNDDEEVFELFPQNQASEYVSSGEYSFTNNVEIGKKIYRILLSDSVEDFIANCTPFLKIESYITDSIGYIVGERFPLPKIAETTPPILSKNPTFIHAALFFNANSIYNFLLSMNDDSLIQKEKDDVNRYNEHFAAAGGNLTFFQTLPKSYSFRKDLYGNTFVHYAALYNKPEILRFAAKNYANFIDGKNLNSLTPLSIALCLCHLKCLNPILKSDYFQQVISRKNNPKALWGPPMLHTLNQSNFEAIPYLIDAGMDITQPELDYIPMLHHAARVESKTVVKQLLKHGFPIDYRDIIGWTALHYAASRGHIHIVGLLLKNGANPLIQTTLGSTPFTIANTFHDNDPDRKCAMLIRKAVADRITKILINSLFQR